MWIQNHHTAIDHAETEIRSKALVAGKCP